MKPKFSWLGESLDQTMKVFLLMGLFLIVPSSISGVIKNIQHLITRERNKTWGKEAWKKVWVPLTNEEASYSDTRG